jgi:hypothetical protein
MSKAEERALEAYPIVMSQYSDNCKEYDSNESDRLTFIEGYHQAEKDLELTWEDIGAIDNLLWDLSVEHSKNHSSNEVYYKEVLKRFLSHK